MKHLLYAALLLLAACGNKNTEQSVAGTSGDTGTNTITLTPEQLRNADLRVETLPIRQGSNSISVRGQIEAPPQNRISVTAPLGGYVKDIRLRIGDRVTKGQTLALLEDMQFIQLQQDYMVGKTRLELLKNEYERQETLSKTQASSNKQAEIAKADFENQKVFVAALSEKLRLLGLNPGELTADNLRGTLPVRSPVNGYVTAININLGKYVSGADVLMELVDPTDIHLALHIFEKDLPYLRVGQRVLAHTNTDPSKKYEAQVILIGKTVMADKSVEVHCHFRSIFPELIPGLYMNADIETNGNAAPALPQEAIITENGKPYVFVKQEANRFALTPVTLQWTQNDSSGIGWENPPASTPEVVTGNAYSLYMQLKNKGE